jgi:ketosteroid isomerase-like protein
MLTTIMAFVRSECPAADGAKGQESSPDLAGIRAGSETFVAAFKQGDSKAVAALWTKDGGYIDDRGRRFAGRATIEKKWS